MNTPDQTTQPPPKVKGMNIAQKIILLAGISTLLFGNVVPWVKTRIDL
jgi:hypothetical protein